MLDVKKLKTDVFDKTGIKLSDADPVFAAVALNNAVLDEYLARATEEMQIAAREIELQTGMNIEKITVIDKRIEEMRARISEFIQAKSQLEIESAKVEIRAAAKSVLAETVNRIAGEANDQIAITINSQLASNIARLREAETKLSRAVTSFGWKWVAVAGGAAAAGIASLALAAWLTTWWQRGQVESLVDQRQALMAEISQMQTKVAALEKRGGKLATSTCGGRLCIEASTNQGEGQTEWRGPWNGDKGAPMVIPKGH